MEVIALKLVTGEDVLGEIVEQNNESTTLENPVGIAVVRGPDGNPNIGFSPFPLHGSGIKGYRIRFENTMIVYRYTPAPDFISNYEQIFGVGIILPTPKQLITG